MCTHTYMYTHILSRPTFPPAPPTGRAERVHALRVGWISFSLQMSVDKHP